MSQNNSNIWVEKYRPLKISDMLGDPNLLEKMAEYIQMDRRPHLLLTGSAGTGKTTIAKLIIEAVDCDVLYLNGSDENGIDVVRQKIKFFAQSNGFGSQKFVFIDECEYLTKPAQAALRNIIDECSDLTSFIMTCNYVDKLIAPIISRCQHYVVSPSSKSEVAKRLHEILVNENVEHTTDDIVILVNKRFPDIRKMIHDASSNTVNGVLKINESTLVENDANSKILQLLLQNKSQRDTLTDVRKYVSENKISDFSGIYRCLYDNVDELSKTGNLAELIIAIAEGNLNDAIVIDKEINFISTIVQIISIVKK